MRLTRSIRKKLNRKLRPNWTQENLFVSAFRRQVERQLIEKIKKANSLEEVDEIIDKFSIAPLEKQIDRLSRSTFSRSSREFDQIVDAFLNNPKNVYLKLRAKQKTHI